MRFLLGLMPPANGKIGHSWLDSPAISFVKVRLRIEYDPLTDMTDFCNILSAAAGRMGPV